MVLIIDSGSTKTDWMLLQGSEVLDLFSTMGFNPFFHNEEIISNAIKDNVNLHGYSSKVSQIFYYGAGCSSKELNAVVYQALKSIFKSAEIEVNHDLTACAYATYTGEPSIACILGTGSNSCYFDGKKIEEVVPASGYILGDEGSGSYYGKQLLRDFLYHKLPVHIRDDFKLEFNLDKGLIFENVYKRPHANVYLASFMKFIAHRKDDPYFKDMVVNGMRDFLSIHVTCYDNYKNLPVNFIGSIAHYFSDELGIAAKSLNISIGEIVRKPILGLVNYHTEHGHLKS